MSKISVRNGTMEFEFEGSEEFIKDGFLDLLSDVLELAKGAPSKEPDGSTGYATSGVNMSVKTISAKLGNSSGPDLARAAAAFLTLAQKRETFTQQELLNAMKSATGIYKQTTHGKNSGKIVSSLVSNGVLLQTASGTYSLAEAQRDQISNILNG
jgi:hypothetical protein